MIRKILSFAFCCILLYLNLHAQKSLDYTIYHSQVIDAEKLIAAKNYAGALSVYEQLFQNYDFIFLKEFKIANQLAFQVKDHQKGLHFLEEGIKSGWTLKSIKRNKFILKTLDKKEWKGIKKKYTSLKKEHKSKLDLPLRKQVKKMLSKDQWKAFNVFFRIRQKAKDKYIRKKFTPHSEAQMKLVLEMLKTKGYPGERLIGNDFWMSTIISHHNSQTQEYVKQDTFYPIIKPKLIASISKGQLSPYELLIIDDWYHSVLDRSLYGIINAPLKSDLQNTNLAREKIFVRSIETRNKLVDIEKETGMTLYLDVGPWVNGKILAQN